MRRYSEDPGLRADGHPDAEALRDRIPRVGAGARAAIARADSLSEALFDIADVFRVPLTNNVPWFEDGDPDRPVYAVSDFIAEVSDAFTRAGWAPPQPQPGSAGTTTRNVGSGVVEVSAVAETLVE